MSVACDDDHLSLVADVAQQIMPPCDIGFFFHSFRGTSVNYSHHATTLLGARQHDFDGVGAGEMISEVEIPVQEFESS